MLLMIGIKLPAILFLKIALKIALLKLRKLQKKLIEITMVIKNKLKKSMKSKK
jgi:hypothetical protein